MSNRLFFIILTIILIMLSITFRFIKFSLSPNSMNVIGTNTDAKHLFF